MSFVFHILDYYHQHAYVNTTSSIKLMIKKNKILSEILKSNDIYIDGQTNTVVVNGIFIFNKLNMIRI